MQEYPSFDCTMTNSRTIQQGQEDVALMCWPPRSPDLTPCDFYLWGFVKDTVFVPPVPDNLQELHDLITTALALIDRDMLTRVLNELVSPISAKVDTLSICDV